MPHKNLPAGERKRRTTAALATRKKEAPPEPAKETMVVIVEEEHELWDRLPDEPEISYKRFDVFLRKGPGRKLQDVVDFFKETPDACGYGNVKWLSRTWSWTERAKSFDSAEQQRYLAITAQDRAYDATKVSYVARKALSALERVLDDEEHMVRMLKTSSPKEIAQFMGAAGDLYKVVHGTKTVTEGDAAGMTFNGPVQVNVSDEEKARDLKAQISPYADVFRQIAEEAANAEKALDHNVDAPEDAVDAEFEGE